MTPCRTFDDSAVKGMYEPPVGFQYELAKRELARLLAGRRKMSIPTIGIPISILFEIHPQASLFHPPEYVPASRTRWSPYIIMSDGKLLRLVSSFIIHPPNGSIFPAPARAAM